MEMNSKKVVGVFFGGKSGEHEVSIESAISVINHLRREKYLIVPIYIRKDNSIGDAKSALKGKINEEGVYFSRVNIRRGEEGSLIKFSWYENEIEREFDFFLPVLHGPYGEDGTIQGLFEMADVPYWGCDVGASAVGMDKVLMKYLFIGNKLPVVDFVSFEFEEFRKNEEKILEDIGRKLNYPLFVKPARMGSSVGISKVKDEKFLRDAILLAFKHDYKVLVENGVEKAREIECSVMGNFEVYSSFPGEIIPAKEFYDYEAKYGGLDSKLLIPAPLKEGTVSEIRDLAIRAFKSIGGKGFARVDFLLDKDENIFINEINTIPGFTTISMFPKLWGYSGLKYEDLLDKLIELGFKLFKEKGR